MRSKRSTTYNTCLLCNNTGRFLFLASGRDVLWCEHCQLGWISNFLMPDYSLYHRDETYKELLPLFENIFRKLLRAVSPYFRKPGRMFDVGASVGTLMNVFKNAGWTVSGLEPSTAACEVANSRGFSVLGGPFEEAAIKGSYDLVVINHTLEHMDNPLHVLNKINSLLTEGGIMLIGVPNFGGWSARLFRSRWDALLPEEHKWQFSKTSLQILLERSGFYVLESFTTTGVFDCEYPWQEVKRSFLRAEKRFFSNVLGFVWAYLTTRLGAGDGIVVIARKTKTLLQKPIFD